MLPSVCYLLLVSVITVFLFCYWFWRTRLYLYFVMVLWWCFLRIVRQCGPVFLALVFVVILVHVAGAVALVIIVWEWSGCYLVLFLGMYSFHEVVYGSLLMFWRLAWVVCYCVDGSSFLNTENCWSPFWIVMVMWMKFIFFPVPCLSSLKFKFRSRLLNSLHSSVTLVVVLSTTVRMSSGYRK